MIRYWIPTATLLLLAACEEGSTNPDEILRLDVLADSAPADGSAVVGVEALVDRSTKSDRRTLSFSTTLGTFVEAAAATATATADEDGRAFVGLRSPTEPGVAYIRVKTGDETRLDSLRYVRAFAEQIFVEPERFAVKAGVQNEIKITAFLRRAVGKVTPGAIVRFRAFQAGTNTEVGQFGVATVSDASGTVTVRYTPGNTPYRGSVRIVAETTNAAGVAVLGEALVEVIDS